MRGLTFVIAGRRDRCGGSGVGRCAGSSGGSGVLASRAGDSVVVRENSITVIGLIADLHADAGRALVKVDRGEDCPDVLVWDRLKGKIVTVFDHRWCAELAPLGSFGGVALTGDKAAYAETSGGNTLESYITVMSLATGRSSHVAAGYAGGQGAWGNIGREPQGRRRPTRLGSTNAAGGPDVGPDVPCPPGYEDASIVSDQIRLALPTRRVIASSADEMPVLAVGGGRVVALQALGRVIVLAPKRTATSLVQYEGFRAERLIASYKYNPAKEAVFAAATDGRTLAIRRQGAIDVIALPGSHGTPATRTLSVAGQSLADLDGNTAVYLYRNAVYLLNLTTGRTVIFARPLHDPSTRNSNPTASMSPPDEPSPSPPATRSNNGCTADRLPGVR